LKNDINLSLLIPVSVTYRGYVPNCPTPA